MTRWNSWIFRHLFLIVILALWPSCFAHAAHPSLDGRVLDERIVKAAFLYKFLLMSQSYADGQRASKDAYVICLLDAKHAIPDHFFSPLTRKLINGRPLTITKIPQAFSHDSFAACDVIFAAGLSMVEYQRILNRVKDQPTITVSDSEQFLELGGMIQLSTKQGHVIYSINQQSIRSAGLRFPPQVYQFGNQSISQ